MKRISIHLPVALALLAATTACAGRVSGPGAQQGKPNVILVIADDLGYADIGPYGQQKIRTPRLDQMAREGTRFTQFYAGSPVCAPSRSTLMTGQHTGRTFIRGNPGQVTPAKQLGPRMDYPLPDSVVTMAEVLRQAGYTVGGFGKWGLGYPGSEGDARNQGFDRFFGHLSHVEAHRYYPPHLWDDSRQFPLAGNDGKGQERTYSHDVIVDQALAFLDQQGGKPFFLYLPFTIPHAELRVPADAYAPYLDASGKSIFPETPYAGAGNYGAQPMPRATYAAMITRMDRDIGRVMDRLKAKGLDRNTIILVTSDNGPSVEGGIDPVFFDSNGPLRGFKRDVYEGGIRVPMLAWGPGHIPAGRSSDHVWANWDVLPTLAGFARTRAPAGIDGLDMSAALTGRGSALRHPHLYWEFHEQGGKQAVLRGNWKAVRLDVIRNPNGPIELYDLSTDPGEERDVAARHPELVREMAAIMAREHVDSEIFPALNGAD